MNIKLRALFGVSALALLFVASPVLAAEVGVDAENVLTGADSDNENEFDIENENETDVDNHGDVENKADAKVNTGDNEQEKNTSAGDLETGAVDASTDWETFLNEGAGLAGFGEDLDVTGSFLNDTTGAYSDNENELDLENKNELDIDNWADVLNKLGLKANTGDNEQEKNTMAGDIDTGDIEGSFGIYNDANNNAYADGNGGSTSVNVEAENFLTGYNSDNENEFDIENKNEIDIDNHADFYNKIEVKANTGGNEQEKNTTGGSITTGGVAVETSIENFANNGSGAAGIHGSSLEVDAEFANGVTGADSDNENELDVENKNEVDIDNHADVDNKLEVDANTGDNEQEKNTTAGDISTGDVSVSFNVVTQVNSN